MAVSAGSDLRLTGEKYPKLAVIAAKIATGCMLVAFISCAITIKDVQPQTTKCDVAA